MNRREFLALGLSLPVVGAFSKTAFATTWGEKEFTCPVCATKNIFRVVMSYGSYIYSWPSKYQLIYWPVTDSNSVYCCKTCNLSMFMWDYEELAKEKIPDIKKLLPSVSLKTKFTDYAKVPMTSRLEIAEKVYGALGEKEDFFWCWFHRILGYHHAAEKNASGADEARKKALDLAQKMLNDKNNKTPAKELLVIQGAMRHFLRDDEGANKDFNRALETKYENKELDAEKNNNGEQNLNALVKDYLERIKGPNPPRDHSQ
jgi:uncharacterized protein (DUF2225 family)